jgi:hypothetical protein
VRPPRILATRLETVQESMENPRGIRVSRVVLERAPETLVCQLQAIMGGWWQRSGGYPAGREFGSMIG